MSVNGESVLDDGTTVMSPPVDQLMVTIVTLQVVQQHSNL